MQPLRHNPLRGSRHGSPFTLIELLVVMGIMVILLAIAGPAFDRMTIGTGVDAGVRAMTGQLRLARQYAIANRKYVAVLMPTTDDFSDDARYAGTRAVRADSVGGPYAAIPDTAWEFLPTGAIVFEVHQNPRTAGDALPASPTDDCDMNVSVDLGGNPTVADVRAIVFTPTGALAAGTEHIVTIAQGVFNPSTGAVQVTNPTNWRELRINAFTGRIKVN